MARGFESKDVEFQQAEAERSARKPRGLTAAEREAQEKRRSLELALTKLHADRSAATNPHHRVMVDRAIGALEAELDRARRDS